MQEEIVVKKSLWSKIFKLMKIASVVTLSVLGLIFLILVVYALINPTYTEEDILKRINSDINPSVVSIRCFDNDTDKSMLAGTGLYYLEEGTRVPMVETNAHVVLGSDGLYHGCTVFFPRADGSFYESAYETNEPQLYHNIKGEVDGRVINGIDYALLPLKQGTSSDNKMYPFPPVKPDAYTAIADMCEHSGSPSIEVGGEVYLLGYPNTGGDSLTTTEGIVSGFKDDKKQWIKISASTNHGNSGGIAIGSKDGCNYGIPTRATFTSGANLGFLLNPDFIRKFASSATGVPTHIPFTIDTDHKAQDYLTQTYDLKDFSIKYPDGWSVSTTSPARDGHYTASFISPQENAINSFEELFSVMIYPNSTVSDFKTVMGEIELVAKSKDKTNKAGDLITFKGLTAYQNNGIIDHDFYDVSSKSYLTVFLKNNTLYIMSGESQLNLNETLYQDLYKAITDSIQFK